MSIGFLSPRKWTPPGWIPFVFDFEAGGVTSRGYRRYVVLSTSALLGEPVARLVHSRGRGHRRVCSWFMLLAER